MPHNVAKFALLFLHFFAIGKQAVGLDAALVERNYFKGWASRENLDFIDEGNYFRLFDKEQNKTILIVSIRPFRFKLTDKSN